MCIKWFGAVKKRVEYVILLLLLHYYSLFSASLAEVLHADDVFHQSNTCKHYERETQKPYVHSISFSVAGQGGEHSVDYKT